MRNMDTVENPVHQPRSERIARYKAERRRELAERFGKTGEVRRDGKEKPDPSTQTQRGSSGDTQLHTERINGRKHSVTNGLEADKSEESNCLRRQGSASMLSGEGHLVPHGPDVPQLRTRVSVGRLRSALLQQAGSGVQPDKVPDSGRATSSLDLAVKPGLEGGRRRTRRYLPGGSGSCRKTSDRFRTQPITANEMQESSGVLDVKDEDNLKADVKTDERAKMSVAAKMSLFKELEKSAAPEASTFLKPRSGSVCHERRVRRGHEHRFLTQPITCEEMVAISAPKPAPPVEAHSAPVESAEDGDESCKLSMSEKLALFNKLSLPETEGSAHADGPPERRRQKGARYRTQPITVEEVSLLQKGPVQLPTFSLSPHLSDRQQALSVNLKPSELRLSQSRPDISPGTAESGPAQQGLQRCDSEPGLRGILKRGCSGNSDCYGTDGEKIEPLSHKQNGSAYEDGEVQEAKDSPAVAAPPRRERRKVSGVDGGPVTAAPWRQRARNRRETIACTPVRVLSEHSPPREERPYRVVKMSAASVEHGSDMGGAAQQEVKRAPQSVGHVQVTLVDGPSELQGAIMRKEEREYTYNDNALCWEPVFASVYCCQTPQYIMCFNQTIQSFEAQEVSSPKNQIQSHWRPKAKDVEEEKPQVAKAEEISFWPERKEEEAGRITKRSLESPESDRSDTCHNKRHSVEAPTCTYEEISMQPEMEFEAMATPASVQRASPPLDIQEVKRMIRVDDSDAYDRGFDGEQSRPAASSPLPCGWDTPGESEQDLGLFCQTNTPMLSSAVAEHRRAVRPSRRTQGSRNPLRALAAREDIRQDYMGERAASEERTQEEKKSKNSSTPDSHPARSTDIPSLELSVNRTPPPFSSRMLLHIKGRQHVQVRLAEPSVCSLNSGDCFLLVTPEHCILWNGEFANKREKTKAAELASVIQAQGDLGCRAAQILHLDEGVNSDSSLAADFWEILGGRTQYRGAGPPEEDELFERGIVESNCVYMLVENRLVPHDQAWACAPSRTLLESNQVFLFDFGSELYLWLGEDVSAAERSVALKLTHQVWVGTYDYSNCRVNPLDPTQSNTCMQPTGEGRPSWALFGCILQHGETALFREKFPDWTGGEEGQEAAEDRAQSTPTQSLPPAPLSPDLLRPCDPRAMLLGRPSEEDGVVPTVLAGVDIQRGYGVVTLEGGQRGELRTTAVDTWHVQEFDDSEIPLESTGQLHEGDSYVIRWTYSISAAEKTNDPDDPGEGLGQKENAVLFVWRGRHSNAIGRGTVAFLSIGMSDQEESTVVVHQEKEPPCFLQLFHGHLVIHKGTREAFSMNTAECGSWRLFCVRGELPEEASLLEVDCCCASLRSRGCLVLMNGQQGMLYLWLGCKAHGGSREAAMRAVEDLTQMCPPELGLSNGSPVKVEAVEEGSEPADFWTALGQMDRKAYDCMLQDPGKFSFTPRLFHLSASSGSFQAVELQSPSRLPGLVMAMPFVQESLFSAPPPSLFLLDNRLEVYLWQRNPAEQPDPSAPAWSRWQNEQRCAMETALQYCKEMNPRRPPQAYLIFEGSEPLTFTNVFPRWERNLEPHAQGDTGQVRLTLVQDALARLTKTRYPLEQLLQSPLPEGVDPQHLEVYLSDRDFQTILEMKRDEYASLPSWQQNDLKKNKGLLC